MGVLLALGSGGEQLLWKHPRLGDPSTAVPASQPSEGKDPAPAPAPAPGLSGW